LKGSSRTIEREPEVSPERDPKTWVGPSGNVVRDFKSVTPFQLVNERANGIQPRRPDAAQIRQALGIGSDRANAQLSFLKKVPSGALTVEAIEVSSAEKVWLPAWLFTPGRNDPSQSVILLLDEHGRNQHWREDGLAEHLASRGHQVCVADIRGIGDLKPEVGRGAPGYTIPHDEEEDYAWASLILGKPLLGQRVTDILAWVQALAPRGRIVIAASGRLTVPALFAAAFEKQIDTAYLSSGLISLKSVVTTESYKLPLANIAANLLSHTDLPDLTELLAPRKLYLAGSVDGAGRKMDREAVKKIYPQSHVAVSEEQEWTAEKLSSL
jgi:hypothetical protein